MRRGASFGTVMFSACDASSDMFKSYWRFWLCRCAWNMQSTLSTMKTAVIRIVVKSEVKMEETFKLSRDKTVSTQAEINTIP